MTPTIVEKDPKKKGDERGYKDFAEFLEKMDKAPVDDPGINNTNNSETSMDFLILVYNIPLYSSIP